MTIRSSPLPDPGGEVDLAQHARYRSLSQSEAENDIKLLNAKFEVTPLENILHVNVRSNIFCRIVSKGRSDFSSEISVCLPINVFLTLSKVYRKFQCITGFLKYAKYLNFRNCPQEKICGTRNLKLDKVDQNSCQKGPKYINFIVFLKSLKQNVLQQLPPFFCKIKKNSLKLFLTTW